MTVVNLCAPGDLDPYDSYGLIACRLVRHLSALGVYVNPLPLGEATPPTQDAALAALCARPIRAATGALYLGYPTGYHHHHHNPLTALGPQVALTMFESSRLPAGWADVLNRMDAVITPSTFCAQVFRDCGVTAPVYVVPLGLGESFTPAPRPDDGPLTFLAFLDRGKRKGGLAALNAFVRAFGDRDDVRLVLKCRERETPPIILNPNVEVLRADLTEAALADLYRRCHVLINPHLGEGFGLIPREFAATGGVAVTTAWSGTTDDLPAWGVGIPYDLVEADWGDNRTLAGQDLGVWAVPDRHALARTLWQMAASWERWAQFGARAAVAARTLYNWERFAGIVLAIWEEVCHARRNVAQPAAA